MIKYIKPIPVASAEGLLAELYDQLKREIGAVVEPYMMHSSSPAITGRLLVCFKRIYNDWDSAEGSQRGGIRSGFKN